MSYIQAMPCLGVFLGIKFYVYAADHGVPHVHVQHGDEEATLEITSGRIIRGELRVTTKRHAIAWLEEHRTTAMAAWVRLNGNES